MRIITAAAHMTVGTHEHIRKLGMRLHKHTTWQHSRPTCCAEWKLRPPTALTAVAVEHMSCNSHVRCVDPESASNHTTSQWKGECVLHPPISCTANELEAAARSDRKANSGSGSHMVTSWTYTGLTLC